MNIVYQFNEKYVPYAGVSITSIIENNPKYNIKFHILGENLSNDSINRLRSFSNDRVSVSIYKTTDIILKMKGLGMPSYRGSYAANLRMFLPEFLDESIERVLYLDADTVVVGDIGEVLQYELQGKCIGMSLDSLGGKHATNIGLKKGGDYFNSGVIIFDLKKWKANNYTGKIISHIQNKRAFYPSPDQDLLNIICEEDIKRIPISFNFQPIHKVISNQCFDNTFRPLSYYSSKEIEKGKEEIVVYHCFRFNGEFPWHKDNLHPFGKYFDYYLMKSPWKDMIKKKAEKSLVLKIEKVLYKVLPKDLYGYIFCVAHGLYIRNINKKILKQKIKIID